MNAVRKITSPSRNGFTLLELIIVLAVAGVLFGGLFQILSNSNTQLEAESAAQQQQNLIRAVRTYVINNFATLSNTSGGGLTVGSNEPLNTAMGLGSMAAALTALTPQQPTTNPFGQSYAVYLRNSGPAAGQTVSFMIAAAGGTPMTDKMGGTVSSLIGAEGGFIYSTSVTGCTGNITTAYNGACIPVANYGATPGAGHIASVSFVTSNDIGNDISQYLDRLSVAGLPIVNTMQTELQFLTATSAVPDSTPAAGAALAMGGNNIYMNGSSTAASSGGAINMQGGGIYMAQSTATTGGGALSMQGGNIYMAQSGATTGPGTLYTNSGNIDMTSGGQIEMSSGCSIAPNGTTGISIISTGGTAGCDFYDNNPIGGSMTIHGINGTFGGSLSATSFIYSSDRRLKKDIEPLPDDMLQKLLALQPVSFRWKNNDKKDIGLVAQDVEKQFPELVETNKDTGYLAVKLGNLVSPIIQALRELHEENLALKKQLARQQDELDTLRDSAAH